MFKPYKTFTINKRIKKIQRKLDVMFKLNRNKVNKTKV